MKKLLSVVLTLILASQVSHAQLNVTPNPGINNFMNTLFAPGSGVTYSNVTVNCDNQAYGTFSNGNTTNIGITNGVILATGNVTNAIGPNNSGSAGNSFGTFCTDAQLTAVTNSNFLFDCCIIEFDIVSQCSQLQVRFVFGSEEYPEYVNASVNDGFGFWITGPGYTNYNMAQLPNGTFVSIDNVNANVNNAYYVTNTGNTIQYDAFTTVITHTINITPCATYHLKLAISDAGDGIYDSGVFIDYIACANPVVVNTNTTPASCSSLGSATANVTGGIGPFSYSWNTTPVQNTQTATNLPAGTYTVTVTDLGSACPQPIQATATVTGSGSVTVTPGSNSPICAGSALNLTVNATAGATYSWTGPNGFTSTAQNPTIPAATTAASGVYTVTVTAGACSNSNSINVTVNPQPTVTPGSNSPVCVGQTLNLTVNATAGATYSWTGPNGFTSTTQNPSIPAATTAASGVYTVTVTANGCANSNTVNVLINTTFNSTITPAGPFCTTSAPVNLTAVDPGGTWSGTGITNAATGTFDPSAAGAGTHNITYTIPGSCGSSSNTNIVVNAQPTVTPGSNSPICEGQTLNLTVNATAGGNYNWTGPNGFSSTAQNPSIAAATTAASGVYTVTVTANGCTNSNTVNVTVNTVPNTSITPAGPFCANNANTFLAAIDPGGTWSGPGIINATTGEFSPTTAGAGNHVITYSIAGACPSSSTTNIQVIANANASINPAGPFCIVDPATNLTSVQTGGVWSGTGITNAATGTFNPNVAGAGTHTITYTISGVCGDAQTTNITVVAQLPSTITPVGPFCVNAASVALQGASPGGTWSGTGITNAATGTFNPATAGAGTHNITYTTPGSCGTSSSTNIVVNALPQVSFVADVVSGCLPLTVNLTNNSTPQGTNCTWSIDGLPSNNSCTVFTNTFTQPGCYTISLQTTDANGCSNSQTLNNYICVSDIPQAEFSHNPTNATILDPTVNFTNQSVGASNYVWDFGGLSTSTQTHPTYVFPAEPGTYQVCLTASNAAGCVDDVCHNVIIYDEFLVYAPNAFTPTGDGINDVFLPIVSGHDIMSYELMIFNRWGDLIFQTDVSTKGWDGTHKGQTAKEDVYVWKLKVKRLYDGKKFEFKGHVTLLR